MTTTPRIIEPQYICPECGDSWNYKPDALCCCLPSIEDVYICPGCKEQYTTEDDAIACCIETGEYILPYRCPQTPDMFSGLCGGL